MWNLYLLLLKKLNLKRFLIKRHHKKEKNPVPNIYKESHFTRTKENILIIQPRYSKNNRVSDKHPEGPQSKTL